MPVTTFHNFDVQTKHEKAEVQEMLELLCKLSGQRWAINHYMIDSCRRFLFFGKVKHKYLTELLCEVPGVGNAQILSCVRDEQTLLAYLYGAVGQLEKIGKG
jgi:hypothetical protein